MTHLILHKVRGQPAFDVAEQLENGMWIIPTSGHRAYPIWQWPLNELHLYNAYYHNYQKIQLETMSVNIPANLPDHYSINDRKQPDTITLVSSYQPKPQFTADDL